MPEAVGAAPVVPGGLALLRRLTRAAYRVRGVRRLTDFVRLRYARQGGRYRIEDFDGDVAMELDLSEHLQSQIFWQGVYSPEEVALVGRLLGPEDTFLDIGANVGEFVLKAAKLAPRGRVFGVEPAPHMFAALTANLALNGFSHVVLRQLALSTSEGEIDLYIPDTRRYGAGLQNTGIGNLFTTDGAGVKVTVPATTLDRFAAEESLERLDLIKLDVEGAELLVLRGGEATLRRLRPKILVEVNQVTCGWAGHTCAELTDFLVGLGYQLACVRSGGRLEPYDAATARPLENVLCTSDAGRPQ
jgi:FkbM family methyltransferase